jgi:N-methylhydantoinase A
MKEIVERFHRRHEELYTYSLPDQDVVLVNARLAVVGVLPALPEEPALPARPPADPRGRRRAYFGAADGWRDVPVYDLDAVAPGQRVAGPAIFEAATTTALVREGETATVTRLGWLDVSLGGGGAS